MKCSNRGCNNEVVNNRKRCEQCLESSRSWRKRRKENKLCYQCGVDVSGTGKTKCQRCIDYSEEERLRRRYGVTRNWLLQTLEEQNNSCAICKLKFSKDQRRYCVDHDHNTGKARGLLCDKCNVGLHFMENHQYVERSRTYLAEHQQ